jgi:hypothetical protein
MRIAILTGTFVRNRLYLILVETAVKQQTAIVLTGDKNHSHHPLA